MSRFDVIKFIPPPDQELICGICMHVLDMPQESPCRHVFCKVCIGKALQEKSKCPLCRSSVKESQLKDVLPLVQNMLNKLTMRCDNYCNGCTELIQMERYINHLTSCDYVMVTCRFNNCGQSLLKINQRHHEMEECVYRDVVCTEGCGLTLPWRAVESHKCLGALLSANKDLHDKNKALESTIDDLNVVISALNSKLQEYEGKNSKNNVQKSNTDAERQPERSPESDSDVGSPTYSVSSLNSIHYDDYDYLSEPYSDISVDDQLSPVSPDFEGFISDEQNDFGNEETQHAEFDPRYAANDIDEYPARDSDWNSNFHDHTYNPPHVENENDPYLYDLEVAASEQVETHMLRQDEDSVQASITVSAVGQSAGPEEGGSMSSSRKRFQSTASTESTQSKRRRTELDDDYNEPESSASVRRSRRLQNREPSPANQIQYVDVPPSAAYLLDQYANERDSNSSDDESWSPSSQSQYF